jgi:hypothetical protein
MDNVNTPNNRYAHQVCYTTEFSPYREENTTLIHYKDHIWLMLFNLLNPSGKYMSHLLQSVSLRFVFMGFFMFLSVDSDYFVKQH